MTIGSRRVGHHRRTRRFATVVGGFLVIFLVGLAGASNAAAHAVLEDSSPRDHGLITGTAITQVQLTFSEPVDAGVGALRVVAADGSRVDSGIVQHPDGADSRIEVGLREGLSAGSYLVLWHVISADSHPVSGSFVFSLGHPGRVASAAGVASSVALGVALGISRFIAFAGMLTLVGAICFLAFCWPAGTARRRSTLLVSGAAATAAIGAVVEFVLQAGFDTGGVAAGLDPTTMSALLATRFGHAHLLRVFLIGCTAALWLAYRRARSRELAYLAICGGGGVLATAAADGHAATSASWTGLPLDLLHLVCAAVWLGGLVVLVVAVLPAARRAPAMVAVGAGTGTVDANIPERFESCECQDHVEVFDAVKRFSGIALLCVLGLVTSGVLQALPKVREAAALTGTNYGHLLIAKCALLAVLLVFAAGSRAAVHRRRSTAQLALPTSLSRTVAAETALGAVIVAVTAALVATTPATVAYRPTVARTVHAGPVTVDLTAVPRGPHTVDLHAYIFGRDGLIRDIPAMSATAEGPASAGGAVTVPWLPAGPGHYIANGVLLPAAGTWTLRFQIRTSRFDSFPATTSLTVR